MNIREAEPQEARKITEKLWKPLAEEMEEVSDYNELSDEAFEKSLNHRKENLESEDRLCLLAEEDTELTGLIVASIKEPAPIFKRSRYAKVHEIFVKPDHRSQGVASQLFEKMEEWAERKDCEAVELSVDRPNKKAINFYEKLGMEEVRKIMRKKL